eukprot:403363599
MHNRIKQGNLQEQTQFLENLEKSQAVYFNVKKLPIPVRPQTSVMSKGGGRMINGTQKQTQESFYINMNNNASSYLNMNHRSTASQSLLHTNNQESSLNNSKVFNHKNLIRPVSSNVSFQVTMPLDALKQDHPYEPSFTKEQAIESQSENDSVLHGDSSTRLKIKQKQKQDLKQSKYYQPGAVLNTSSPMFQIQSDLNDYEEYLSNGEVSKNHRKNVHSTESQVIIRKSNNSIRHRLLSAQFNPKASQSQAFLKLSQSTDPYSNMDLIQSQEKLANLVSKSSQRSSLRPQTASDFSKKQFESTQEQSLHQLKYIIEQKKQQKGKQQMYQRNSHNNSILQDSYLDPQIPLTKQQDQPISQKQQNTIDKAIKNRFGRKDLRVKERILDRERGNSFYNNQILLEKQRNASILREFKHKAENYRSLIGQMKNKDLKSLLLQTDKKARNLSQQIDFDRSTIQDNFQDNQLYLQKIKDLAFANTDIKQALNDARQKQKSQQNLDSYIFHRIEYLKKNPDYQKDLREFQVPDKQSEDFNPIQNYGQVSHSINANGVQNNELDEYNKNLDQKYLRSFKQLQSTLSKAAIRIKNENDLESQTQLQIVQINKSNSSQVQAISKKKQTKKIINENRVIVDPFEQLKYKCEKNQIIKQDIIKAGDSIYNSQLFPEWFKNDISKYSKKEIIKGLDIFKIVKEVDPDERTLFEKEKVHKFLKKSLGKLKSSYMLVKSNEKFLNFHCMTSIKLFQKWPQDQLISFYQDIKQGYFLKDHGKVKVETMFDIENIQKTPLENKLTEWTIHNKTLLKKINVKEAPDWFGFEEIVQNGMNRILKVTALTDCQVLYGSDEMLLDYLSKFEKQQLNESIQDINVGKIGHQYTVDQKKQKDKLKYFLDGSNFNQQQFESTRETFKDNARQNRLKKWVTVLSGCKSQLDDISVVKCSTKKVITANSYLQEKRIKDYPSVVINQSINKNNIVANNSSVNLHSQAYQNSQNLRSNLAQNIKGNEAQQMQKRVKSAYGNRNSISKNKKIQNVTNISESGFNLRSLLNDQSITNLNI